MLSHHHHHQQLQQRNSTRSHSETIICNGKIANIWKLCLFYSRSYTITIDQIYLSLDLIHAVIHLFVCSLLLPGSFHTHTHTHIDDTFVRISTKVIIYNIA